MTTPIVTIARRELVLLVFFTSSAFSFAGALDRLIVRKLNLTPIVKTFVEWIPSRFEPKGMKKHVMAMAAILDMENHAIRPLHAQHHETF